MADRTPKWAKDLSENLEKRAALEPQWAQALHAKLNMLLEELRNLNAAPPAAQAFTQPTFCGYRCSWDIDDAGWPSYIHLEDGTLASHREKQGHHWYSVSLGDGQYGEHYLKFLRATPPEGLLVMPAHRTAAPRQAPAVADEAPPPEEDNPFDDDERADENRLRELHELGREVYSDQWGKHGRALIRSTSGGRTDSSADLTPHEAYRIISLLRQNKQRKQDWRAEENEDAAF